MLLEFLEGYPCISIIIFDTNLCCSPYVVLYCIAITLIMIMNYLATGTTTVFNFCPLFSFCYLWIGTVGFLGLTAIYHLCCKNRQARRKLLDYHFVICILGQGQRVRLCVYIIWSRLLKSIEILCELSLFNGFYYKIDKRVYAHSKPKT